MKTTADLLTHAFVAFTAATLLSWKYDRIKSYHITAAMIGATLPDLTRIGLILDPGFLENTLKIPFSWFPLHTLSGGVMVVGILALLSNNRYREKIFLFLVLGLLTHLVLDIFLISTTGRIYGLLWPLPFKPYAPGFYLSTDILPAIITGSTALFISKFRPDKSE